MFQFARPHPQVSDGVPFPAPIGGMNALDSLAGMPPTDGIYFYNMVHGQYGLKVRSGYRAWVTGLSAEVRTIFPYNNTSGTNELWCTTSAGIYEISASTSSPAIDTAFGITTGLAGWGIWTNFTTIATQFVALCDEANGYYTYDGTTWAKPTQGAGGGQINGVDPALFVHVVSWKERLFFVERNSASAWYLPVGQVTGTVTEFNFGSRFKHGGYLIGLYNWTVDGGDGVDDYLVAIGSGGDIVIFKGTDPASASTFALHGQWFVGVFPAGRRIASSLGGDLMVITGSGVLLLSQLVAGVNISDSTLYETRRITPLVRSAVQETITARGWEINILPREDLLFLSTPKRIGYPYLQFVQNLTSKSWYFYRAFPHVCGTTWNTEFYFGDDSGKVYVHNGTLDNVSINGSTSENIEFSMLTSFQNFSMPTRYKRAQFIRPIFLSGGVPVYEVKSVYDYQLAEISAPSGSPSGNATWDNAIWNTSVWGGSVEVLQSIKGGSNMGKNLAIALRGRATSALTLISFDVILDIGGHL